MRGRLSRRWGLPRLSVRFRILTTILLVTAIGMTVAGATAFFVQRERTLQDLDDRLLSRVEAARFVVTGESATGSGDGEGTVVARADGTVPATTADALEAVLARVVPGRNESSLGIVGGEPTFVPGVELAIHLERDPAFVSRVVDEVSDGSVRLGTALSTEGHIRYIAAPVTVAGDVPGIYVTAVDITAELDELYAAFTTYTVVALGALVAVGLVGWFVAGRLLSPLRQLRAAASRITASERHERIPVLGRDDVSDLTETVNDMLDRLDAAMTGQRQLLDDVRHELKTPITIVRGHLELLDAANVDEVESTRTLAIDELDRMTGLVDDIESLAETTGVPSSAVAVEVARFTADVFAKAEGYVDHEWTLAESAATTVLIDPARITQAWLQLVDNAAKYSPAGSMIELGSSELDGAVEFWVRDAGPGIPADARERIFERFGRVDAGRGIRGSGLGLAIVTAIAAAHGGRVSLETGEHGSRFGIVVPGGPSAPTRAIDSHSTTGKVAP
ncbi:ATP-binding protein [Marisediminicola sp. LYQ134]|uniref:sensor histidine kinase n=1 Tax=Marisediminicola sp. LYQ134 TaxID=3391061 RepID=UPI003982F35E